MVLPAQVLSGGDGEGDSVAARPQQQVAFLGLPLEQEHRLQTGNVVVTPAGPWNRVTRRDFSQLGLGVECTHAGISARGLTCRSERGAAGGGADFILSFS